MIVDPVSNVIKDMLDRMESLEKMIGLFVQAMEHQNKTIDVLTGRINSLELSRKKDAPRIVDINNIELINLCFII